MPPPPPQFPRNLRRLLTCLRQNRRKTLLLLVTYATSCAAWLWLSESPLLDSLFRNLAWMR